VGWKPVYGNQVSIFSSNFEFLGWGYAGVAPATEAQSANRDARKLRSSSPSRTPVATRRLALRWSGRPISWSMVSLATGGVEAQRPANYVPGHLG
jgi:hypothetical protein